MAQAIPAFITNAAITVADLSDENGEPRVADTKLGAALGFGNPIAIRKLVRSHVQTLAAFGEVFSTRKEPGSRGGRPGTEYHLNKKQALYITAKSDTPRAAEVTVAMVEVFDAYLAGQKTIPVKAHMRAQRALPAPKRDGLALFRIAGRDVLVDTNVYDLAESQEALVALRDGTLAIEHVNTRDGQSWPGSGERNAMTQWKEPTETWAYRSRDCVTVLGLVVSGAKRRALLAAA